MKREEEISGFLGGAMTKYPVGIFMFCMLSLLFLSIAVFAPDPAQSAPPVRYTVKATASPNGTGTISPLSRTVKSGTTTTFTVTPNTGYQATMGGTCPMGSFITSTTYMTGIIKANCTVTATFAKIPVNGACGSANGQIFQTAPTANLCIYTGNAPVVAKTETGWQWNCTGSNGGTTANCSANIETWKVTPSSGPEGSISPNTQQTVNHGSAKSFIVTPDIGYTATVGGTCGGSPATGASQFTYTTNAVTADCTVTVAFTLKTLTVASNAGPGGSISPVSPDPVTQQMVVVNYGSPTTFTVTPDGGYSAIVGGTCGGSPASSSASPFIYTTNPVISDCTVSVAFIQNVVPITGACGSANGEVFMTAPTANLCSAGAESAVSGSGPWSWQCTGLNGGATADCSAQYQADLPVLRISGNNEIWHKLIQDACDAASNGDYVLTHDLYIYKEDLNVNSDGVSFTIQGGLDSLFRRITGVTSIYGSITITAGEVTFDNVEILPAQ